MLSSFSRIPATNPKEDKDIGVIIPPVNVREIIDKTAEFVAKNGSDFEELIQNEKGTNSKFSFLKLNHPYRAYYEQKLMEFAQGLGRGNEEAKLEPVTAVPIAQKKDIKKELMRDIRPPHDDKFTVEPYTSISLLDLDVMKLTAQFVAKNGQKFLLALTEREKQNPQFDFLKPTQQTFLLFTNLVGAYSECINSERQDVERIRQSASEKMAILKAAGERVEFEQQQQTRLKETKDNKEEEERITQMAQINWNDFVVVETIIDLFDDQTPPVSSNFDQLETRTIGLEVKQCQSTPTKPLAESDIKKPDHLRKVFSEDSATNQCPLCKLYIPEFELNEHLRIEMLDQNYKDMKADVLARTHNTSLVSDDQVAQNLRGMARERREGETRSSTPPRFIWSGQSETMTRTTASQAMIAQQQKNLYEKLNRDPLGQDLSMSKPVHEKPNITGDEGRKKIKRS